MARRNSWKYAKKTYFSGINICVIEKYVVPLWSLLGVYNK